MKIGESSDRGRGKVTILKKAFFLRKSDLNRNYFTRFKPTRGLSEPKKAMTNLDNVLKSIDIISSTKVYIIKAIAFPVVTYGCVSWTIKNAECQRIDAFEL